MTDACGTCRYYAQSECLRYPAALAKRPDQWCGEYRTRPQKLEHPPPGFGRRSREQLIQEAQARAEKARALRDDGLTWKQIGETIGMSAAGAQGAVRRVEYRELRAARRDYLDRTGSWPDDDFMAKPNGTDS